MLKVSRHTVFFFPLYLFWGTQCQIPQTVSPTTSAGCAWQTCDPQRSTDQPQGCVLNKMPKGGQPPNCAGSSTESSSTRPFTPTPAVSWSQDGCSSSRHHKPIQSHQVQSKTHKFSGGFPSIRLRNPSPLPPVHSPLPLIGQNSAYSSTDHWRRAMEVIGWLPWTPFISLECQFSPKTSISISTDDETILHQFCSFTYTNKMLG